MIIRIAFAVALMVINVASASSKSGWYVTKDVTGYLFEDGEMVGMSSVLLRKGEFLNCDSTKLKGKCCFEEQEGTICLDNENLSRKPVPLSDISVRAIKYALDGKSDPCKGRELDAAVKDAFVPSYGVFLDGDKQPKLLSFAFYIKKNGMRIGYPTINKGMIVSGSGCYRINITKDEIASFIGKYHDVARILNVEVDLNLNVTAELQVVPAGLDVDFSNNQITWETQLPADNVSSWPLKK